MMGNQHHKPQTKQTVSKKHKLGFFFCVHFPTIISFILWHFLHLEPINIGAISCSPIQLIGLSIPPPLHSHHHYLVVVCASLYHLMILVFLLLSWSKSWFGSAESTNTNDPNFTPKKVPFPLPPSRCSTSSPHITPNDFTSRYYQLPHYDLYVSGSFFPEYDYFFSKTETLIPLVQPTMMTFDLDERILLSACLALNQIGKMEMNDEIITNTEYYESIVKKFPLEWKQSDLNTNVMDDSPTSLSSKMLTFSLNGAPKHTDSYHFHKSSILTMLIEPLAHQYHTKLLFGSGQFDLFQNPQKLQESYLLYCNLSSDRDIVNYKGHNDLVSFFNEKMTAIMECEDPDGTKEFFRFKYDDKKYQNLFLKKHVDQFYSVLNELEPAGKNQAALMYLKQTEKIFQQLDQQVMSEEEKLQVKGLREKGRRPVAIMAMSIVHMEEIDKIICKKYFPDKLENAAKVFSEN